MLRRFPNAFVLLHILILTCAYLSAGQIREAPQTVDDLRGLLADSSAANKRFAAASLASMGKGAAAAMPELLRALVDSDIAVRDAASSAVLAVGEDGFPALVNAFTFDDPFICGAAARAIARCGATAIPALSRALQSEKQGVRLCAAIALSHLGGSAAGAAPVLTNALDDSSEIVRWTVCQALRNIGPAARQAAATLLRMAHSDSEEVRIAAAAALRAIDLDLLMTPPNRKQIIARIDTLVPRLMRVHHVPGVAVTIMYDHTIAWSHCYGTADVRSQIPVTPRTMFEACSMSKPVFAYCALKLVEEGELELDRPLVDYLPDLFPHDRSERRDITARMVLTHTTGFPNWREGEEERDGPLPLLFAPGSKFGYSGEGFLFLQQAVERIVGEPLDTYARRTLFAPLGMNHASFAWTETMAADQASGHSAGGQFLQKTRYIHANSAYSLYISADDYARFICEILNPDRSATHSISARMRDTLLGRHVNVAIRDPIQRPGRALGDAVYWGLGWSINSTAEGDIIHHGGSNRSGFRCFAQFNPGEGTGIVIMTNGTGGGELWEEVIREIGDM